MHHVVSVSCALITVEPDFGASVGLLVGETAGENSLAVIQALLGWVLRALLSPVLSAST
jgi:hypothetical protein